MKRLFIISLIFLLSCSDSTTPVVVPKDTASRTSTTAATTASITTSQFTSLSTQVTTLGSNVTKLSTRFSADSSANKKRLTALETTMGTLPQYATISGVLTKNTTQDNLIGTAGTNITTINKTLSAVNGQLAVKDSIIASLKQQLNSLNDTFVASVMDSYRTDTAFQGQLTKLIMPLGGDFARDAKGNLIVPELALSRAQLATLRADLTNLQLQLTALQAKIATK